jgi:hypothetical protein
MDAFFPYQDCYLPSTDIDPRAKVLWPIFVSHDENDPDMEKEMHNLDIVVTLPVSTFWAKLIKRYY